ncbi:SACE_7040 family transcriptional regulator [Salinifilum ghardaiensis]
MDPSAQESRRTQILAAAAERFAQYGFHGVGIDDIGAAVGISGPALYRHFRSKEAVLAEMLTGISERLLHGARERVGLAADSGEALDRLLRWHVEFALTDRALITVQFRDLDSLAEPSRRQVRELQREYVEVWADAMRARYPGMPADTARATAHAVFGLINSTPHSAQLGTEAMTGLLHGMAWAALERAGQAPPAAESA